MQEDYQPRGPPKKEQKPMLDLQFYGPPKQPSKPTGVDPSYYMPYYNQGPWHPPQFNNMWPSYPGMQMAGQMPIINEYKISVDGVGGDHSKLSKIYEDILPRKQFQNTSNTLGERLDINNFVRSVFVKQYDGEDINLNGGGNNSLLSYLKFLDLNPYNNNTITENPYQGLPDDMLIYRSCYPIRHDKMTGQVSCATNSIGMNIRIYKMTFGEYMVKRDKIGYYEFNLWREVAYYEYVREHILKKKVCPNFVMLYAYYICENSDIDFDKLAMVKGKYRRFEPTFRRRVVDPSVKDKEIAELKKQVEELKNGKDTKVQVGGTYPIMKSLDAIPIEHSREGQFLLGIKREANDYQDRAQHGVLDGATAMREQVAQQPQSYIDINLRADSGRALTALTEAPTHSLETWASKVYKTHGNINQMIHTGYHKSEVWFSVLFQIMAALYTMQIHRIAFKNFNISHNVYIKDITNHDNVMRYWKYKIDGIEYYVPNYGYLALIDSNYHDIEKRNFTLGQPVEKERYKIYAKMYESEKKYSDDEINRLCFHAFRNVFSPNAFKNSFVNKGGVEPPDDVLALITKIYEESTSSENPKSSIGHYIRKYMFRFLNNRVGTLLNEAETKTVREDDKDIHRGEVCVEIFQNNSYRFCVFLGATDNKNARIISRKDPRTKELEEITVPLDNICSFSRYETITQNFKPTEANLNEDELLEVYTIEGSA